MFAVPNHQVCIEAIPRAAGAAAPPGLFQPIPTVW